MYDDKKIEKLINKNNIEQLITILACYRECPSTFGLKDYCTNIECVECWKQALKGD